MCLSKWEEAVDMFSSWLDYEIPVEYSDIVACVHPSQINFWPTWTLVEEIWVSSEAIRKYSLISQNKELTDG